MFKTIILSKEALEMRIVKGKKRCECKECGKLILSNDYKYIATEGIYCSYHGRVKSLHDGVMKFIRGISNV